MLENKFSFLYANELNMYYCGKRIQTSHHSYGPEIRTHYLIVLIHEGHATLFHKNGNIRMERAAFLSCSQVPYANSTGFPVLEIIIFLYCNGVTPNFSLKSKIK